MSPIGTFTELFAPLKPNAVPSLPSCPKAMLCVTPSWPLPEESAILPATSSMCHRAIWPEG